MYPSKGQFGFIEMMSDIHDSVAIMAKFLIPVIRKCT